MKFKRQPVMQGQLKQKTAFLWLPKKLPFRFREPGVAKITEFRWLEKATWVQKHVRDFDMWIDICWVEEQPRENKDGNK
jgi:hypothetical protein